MNYMGMRRVLYNIPLLFALAAAWPAAAADHPAPLQFSGVYEFGLSGLRFGSMGIDLSQDAGHYKVAADITLSGIVKWFVKHSSRTATEGSGADFVYPDVTYESRYSTKKKKREVRMVKQGGVWSEVQLVPPDPRRPQVAPELKNAAADPLSFILRMREQLTAALAQGHDRFSLTVFDGRRLSQADFLIEKEPRTIEYRGQKRAVVPVRIKRTPVAGFTASEMDDHDPKEPALTVYFSRDERLLPLRIEAMAWFGLLEADLVKECAASTSCLLGIKE